MPTERVTANDFDVNPPVHLFCQRASKVNHALLSPAATSGALDHIPHMHIQASSGGAVIPCNLSPSLPCLAFFS
jgi:hypothetical protein